MLSENSKSHVLIWNHLLDYHVASMNAFSRFRQEPVTALCISDRNHHWAGHLSITPEFNVQILCPGCFEDYSTAIITCRLMQWLRYHRPKSITMGYSYPYFLSAAIWGRMRGIPIILKSDTTKFKKQRFFIRETIKTFILKFYQSALVPGRFQQDYLTGLGFARNRIHTGLYVVDFYRWDQEIQKKREQEIIIRQRLNLYTPFFLFIGRLVWEKNLSSLLKAYGLYRTLSMTHWPLIIVGNGPLRAQLETEVKTQGVRFEGHCDQNQLADYMATAGALLLPSISESWGQVVLEAMACSLPVIISSACGCAGEVVQDGKNGFVLEPNNIFAWADAMKRISEFDNQRIEIGKAAKHTASLYGPERFAEGLSWCIDRAVSSTKPI